MIKNFLNPKGHQDPISGLIETAILLKGLDFPYWWSFSCGGSAIKWATPFSFYASPVPPASSLLPLVQLLLLIPLLPLIICLHLLLLLLLLLFVLPLPPVINMLRISSFSTIRALKQD